MSNTTLHLDIWRAHDTTDAIDLFLEEPNQTSTVAQVNIQIQLAVAGHL